MNVLGKPENGTEVSYRCDGGYPWFFDYADVKFGFYQKLTCTNNGLANKNKSMYCSTCVMIGLTSLVRGLRHWIPRTSAPIKKNKSVKSLRCPSATIGRCAASVRSPPSTGPRATT